ncbi:MAG TPA: hypothetical protein PLD88_15500, partial [Candidatus Berkiella sp.]|nr:hypothetical protein [Candidatus Berkiella sp.]
AVEQTTTVATGALTCVESNMTAAVKPIAPICNAYKVDSFAFSCQLCSGLALPHICRIPKAVAAIAPNFPVIDPILIYGLKASKK